MDHLDKLIQIIHIYKLKDLKNWAHTVKAHLGVKACVLLNGPMGVGKTQFVKYFVESLGGSGVCSPTFSIHNVYETRGHPVHHVDLYRLESEEDLESTGFWDLFESDNGYILIEWADRVEEMSLSEPWPRDWPLFCISMQLMAETQREIHLSQRK